MLFVFKRLLNTLICGCLKVEYPQKSNVLSSSPTMFRHTHITTLTVPCQSFVNNVFCWVSLFQSLLEKKGQAIFNTDIRFLTVFRRNPNTYQLVQEFATIRSPQYQRFPVVQLLNISIVMIVHLLKMSLVHSQFQWSNY